MSFLKNRRTKLNMSQGDLANLIGVSQQTIARWETKGQIPAKYLKDLALITGSSVTELLEVSGASQRRRGAVSPLLEYTSDDLSDDELERIPFGDVEVVFSASAGGGSMFFPITRGEKLRLEHGLEELEDSTWQGGAWVTFEALNNKWVGINLDHVDRLSFVDDDVVEMTVYESVEVYEAATELYCYELTALMKLAEGDSAEYSKPFLETVGDYLEGKSDDERLEELKCLALHFTAGNRWTCPLFANVASALDRMFISPSKNLPTGRLLRLDVPEEGTTEYVRLAAVKLIEAPLVQMDEELGV